VCAVLFNVVAGFNDGGNLLAAAASSRTIPPPIAFLVIVFFVFVGPLLFGTAVAATIGKGIVDYAAAGTPMLLAGLVGALGAVLLSYAARLPTSMSLALVSAMIGALLAGPGLSGLHWSGVRTVALAMGLSIGAGFGAGAAVYAMLRFLLRPVSRAMGDRLMYLQYATVGLQALGYGANDAEKMMGMMAMAASLGSAAAASGSLAVPLWAILLSVLAFATGMAFGGLRVARTVGGKLFTIRPLHALSFQLAAGITVMAASLFGGPLSTTETTATAIMGTGAATNARMLHWHVAAHIVLAWFVTIPTALALGALAGFLVRHL
jgi:inorganic phosphate transporter, PiT family